MAAYGADGELGTPLMASSGGGTPPEWAGDSRLLFYASDQDKLMSVTITMNPVLSATPPVVVHDLKKLRVNRAEWDIMPDGRLFAVQRGEDEDDITHFDVVLDWSRELRERMAKAAGRAR